MRWFVVLWPRIACPWATILEESKTMAVKTVRFWLASQRAKLYQTPETRCRASLVVEVYFNLWICSMVTCCRSVLPSSLNFLKRYSRKCISSGIVLPQLWILYLSLSRKLKLSSNLVPLHISLLQIKIFYPVFCVNVRLPFSGHLSLVVHRTRLCI